MPTQLQIKRSAPPVTLWGVLVSPSYASLLRTRRESGRRSCRRGQQSQNQVGRHAEEKASYLFLIMSVTRIQLSICSGYIPILEVANLLTS